MKKVLFLLIGVFIFLAASSQAPQAFKYQAVVRNNAGDLITDQNVNFKIVILKGSVSGSEVYTETHSATSNANGLVNLEIGNGTSTDDFSAVIWDSDSYFINIWVNGDEMGTSQLLSVPYALHAKTAESATMAETATMAEHAKTVDNVTVDTANTFNVLSIKGSTPCNASTRGAMRYNETSNTVEYCNGSNWVAMSSGLSIGLPEITTTAITDISSDFAASGGSITGNGGAEIFEKGICWNTTGGPTKNDSKDLAGSGNDTFASPMYGLTSNQTYYVRSFAVNTAGTGFGNEESFSTDAMPAEVSNTVKAVYVSNTSFSTGGQVNVIGNETIQERGIVFGLNPNPTKSDNFVASGSGEGDFTATVTHEDEKTYYYRAYAVNEAGIGYGPEKRYRKHVIDDDNRIRVMPTSSGSVSFSKVYGDSWGYYATSPTDGSNNTSQLVSGYGTDAEAAYMCDTLTAQGFSDWYLPAILELDKVYQNKDLIGIGVMANEYWSSTVLTDKNANMLNFDNGSMGAKDVMLINKVVCIRREE